MRGRTLIIAAVLVGAALAGCIGTDETATPSSAEDTAATAARNATDYELPDEITGFEEAASIDSGSGAGLVVHDDYAYVSALGSGFYVVDVSDPRNPEKVGNLTGINPRDADVLEYEDRTVVALADGADGMHFVDVTQPTRPDLITTFEMEQPVHNLATVPGTHFVYNSRSLGDVVEPGIDIVDASNPANPEIESVWTFPRTANGHPVATTGCHDISVYPAQDRAYCAGVTETFIMGIDDVLEPTIEGVIENPAINIHHWAMPNQDHSILIIGDEYGGTLAPACFGSTTTEDRTVSTPTGAIWFYSIENPEQPIPLGYVSPPTETESPTPCTAHFGDLVGDRPMVAVAWYTQGLVLVDFSEPTSPRIVDQAAQDHNIWDARYVNGHMITGNIDGGSSILSFTGSSGQGS